MQTHKQGLRKGSFEVRWGEVVARELELGRTFHATMRIMLMSLYANNEYILRVGNATQCECRYISFSGGVHRRVHRVAIQSDQELPN